MLIPPIHTLSYEYTSSSTTGEWEIVANNFLTNNVVSNVVNNVVYNPDTIASSIHLGTTTSTTYQQTWVDCDPRYEKCRVQWHQWVGDVRDARDAHLRQTDWLGNTWTTNSSHIHIPDKKSQLKDKIRRQMTAMNIHNHRGDVRRAEAGGANFVDVQQNEIAALQLLRKMTDSDTFRRYLRTGVLSVRGASGLYYAISRKSHLVNVYYDQKLVSRLCVYVATKYKCPPTDDVIAKMIMIECDEPEIWRKANWHVTPKELQEVKNVKSELTAKTLLRLVA